MKLDLRLLTAELASLKQSSYPLERSLQSQFHNEIILMFVKKDFILNT
jgi:hypothetical protein